MSRRRCAEKRKIVPDPKYHDESLSKFVNCLMHCGKKSVAEGIVYGALGQVSRKKGTPVETFHEALRNVQPEVEVRSRRVGGATYQIPVEVRAERARALAIRWLIKCARARGEKNMTDRVAAELSEASEKRGAAFKKREESHRLAEANKAFSHYRW